MATFFGLTALGDEHLFVTKARHVAYPCMQDVPLPVYLRAFQSEAAVSHHPQQQRRQYPHDDHQHAAEQHGHVDQSHHVHSPPPPPPPPSCGSEIRRALLPRVLTQSLGRPPKFHEMELALRYLDMGPGNITIGEFNHGIQCMLNCHPTKTKKEAQGKGKLKTLNPLQMEKKSSYLQLKEDKDRHLLNELGPHDTQDFPLSSNQEYGWEDNLPLKAKRENFPRMKTDVTYNEGICLDNYYKMF